MSHRATTYTVRIHKKGKPKEPFDFGDVDQQGTYLGDVLEALFADDFKAANDDKTRAVSCSSSALDGEDLQLLLLHGESGYAAQIMEPNGQLAFRQRPEHEQLVTCGSVFRLPRNRDLGFWALHVNNNRSAKGLVEAELQDRFKKRFGDDPKLVIAPAVRSDVLTEALEEHLESVTLVKYNASSDFKDAGKWVRKDTNAKVELKITAPEKGKRLVSDLASKARGGDTDAWGQIVEFEGLHFDEAKVLVDLGNGAQRTFRVRGPAAGNPFAAEISPDMTDGELDHKSLFDELGQVLTEMTG